MVIFLSGFDFEMVTNEVGMTMFFEKSKGAVGLYGST